MYDIERLTALYHERGFYRRRIVALKNEREGIRIDATPVDLKSLGSNPEERKAALERILNSNVPLKKHDHEIFITECQLAGIEDQIEAIEAARRSDEYETLRMMAEALRGLRSRTNQANDFVYGQSALRDVAKYAAGQAAGEEIANALAQASESLEMTPEDREKYKQEVREFVTAPDPATETDNPDDLLTPEQKAELNAEIAQYEAEERAQQAQIPPLGAPGWFEAVPEIPF